MRYLILILFLAGCTPPTQPQKGFDTVLLHGRVMDPETGLDAVRNVGISDGRITAITEDPIEGARTIDATGLVVAPGFIDLHSHGQDPANYALKAADGVTAALELEVGTADVDAWYAEREGKALIHHGVAVGHIHVRMQVLGDTPKFLPNATAKVNTTEATDAQLEEIRTRLRRGLKRGAVAMGFGIQYTGGASRKEILECFRVAAEFGASCHVHMRYNGAKEPHNSTIALEEVLAASLVTGAPLHVVHIHSTSISATQRHLAMIAGAHDHGLNVTTECYPYQAGMTDLASAVFGGNWKEELEIDYKDLQWVATGERLTAETFEKHHKEGGLVAIFSIPEPAMRAAIAHPLAIIGSDGISEQGKGHPRAAGTYARILGKFVREEKLISLMEGLRKITLMPAQRLEWHAPVFRKKGRVQVGADADLTLFDAAKIIDRATYEDPTKLSEGIAHVLVGGVPVLKDGKLQTDVRPGRGLRAPIRD